MSVETTWQTRRTSIRERSKFMFNNDRLSDVKFLFRKSGGESERKRSRQEIPAHKFVLSIGSSVFEAMFYGDLAETRTIELPDCEYESVLELFRYMYYDEVNLSGSNVMGILYLAKKYMVPSLAEKCTKYLQEEMDPLNVFSILPTAQIYEEKSLIDRCWNVIDDQTEAAVKSDGFATIDKSLLEAVVSRATLTIEEVELFKAVDLWATKQCQKQYLEPGGEVKRRILGEEIIKAIRFPVMKQKDFTDVVLETKILTPDEVTLFFEFYSSSLTAPVGFSATQRRARFIHGCFRFQKVVFEVSWNYRNGKKDFLGFSVDKAITLHGLCIVGSENNSYKVTLEVKDTSNKSTVVSKTGTYSSKLLKYKRNRSYHGFEVLFDSAAVLKKNTQYQIETLISGPQSGSGQLGSRTMRCSGITFTFSTVKRPDSNGTGDTVGQFPEFLFSV